MGSREIGVRHAPYYVAYSTALARKGDKKEALKVLEKGIRVEARPLNLLKKTMTELQNSQMKSILDESVSVCSYGSVRLVHNNIMVQHDAI